MSEPVYRREVLDPTPKPPTAYVVRDGAATIEPLDAEIVSMMLDETLPSAWMAPSEPFTYETLKRAFDQLANAPPVPPPATILVSPAEASAILAFGAGDSVPYIVTDVAGNTITVTADDPEFRAQWAWQRRILASLPSNPPVTADALRARIPRDVLSAPLPLP